jgi:hypothetical protein
MARQQSTRAPFPISMRTSSIGAHTTERSVSRVSSREALSMSDKSGNGKAHKVLGTADPGHNKLNGARSISGMLESKGSAEDFYQAFLPEPDFLHQLRVRASSPLLGQNYRTNQSSYVPLPSETRQIRKSGSSSDLPSVPDSSAFEFRSKRSTDSNGLENHSTEIGLPGSQNSVHGQVSQKRDQAKETKETKRKRPSRLDLSLLFPKPKAPAAPLLSPQRYTNSPSPVASDYSFSRPRKAERNSFAQNKLTKAPPRSRSNSRKQEAMIPEDAPLPPMPKTVDWFDVPMEKIIRCADEVDAAESPETDDQPPAPTTKSSPSSGHRQFKGLASRLEQSLQQRTGYTKFSVDSAKRVSSNASSTSRSTETHLSPKPMTPFSNLIQNSLQSWQSDTDTRSASNVKKTVSKKASSSALGTSDLTKFSVLSLSDSEDEGEDNNENPVKPNARTGVVRDSVATYGDFEPEICTAEAVLTTKGPTLTRLDKRLSVNSAESRHASRGQNRSRNSSTARSSNSRKKRDSFRLSGIPAISEPDDFHEIIVPRQSVYRNSSIKRRSRVIAVTRQEETLLEAMRQRNGRITPSLFNDITHHTTDPEMASTLLSPLSSRSYDTVHNTDTSFLRLSLGLPSPQGMATSADQGATPQEKEGSLSLGTASDTEQRIVNSSLSPRVSLFYADSLSSPSTIGLASPLTPTLPIHRFSPPAPPPSFAPPAIPQGHSRRRTDSSEAIVLGEMEGTKTQEPEYPLWAVKWGRDGADFAIAH